MNLFHVQGTISSSIISNENILTETNLCTLNGNIELQRMNFEWQLYDTFCIVFCSAIQGTSFTDVYM